MKRLAAMLMALSLSSCGGLAPAEFTPRLVSIGEVVRPIAKQVTLCDSSGCVKLTRDELMAVVRDL